MNKPSNPPAPVTRPPSDQLVSLLTVLEAQIQAALLESNAPAATLVETAHAMNNAAQTVAECLFNFSGSPARVFQDLMMLHDDLKAKGTNGISAVQFHDRLVQCLTHVCASLASLAEFLSSSPEPKSPAAWNDMLERIRTKKVPLAVNQAKDQASKVELF